MKNLIDFIKEDLVEEARIKDFEDVEVGDTGKDYAGIKGEVLYVGTASEMAYYDKQGIMQDMIDDGEVEEDENAVFVELKTGDKLAYVYGPEGFVCYK